jgi:hypothetical protein
MFEEALAHATFPFSRHTVTVNLNLIGTTEFTLGWIPAQKLTSIDYLEKAFNSKGCNEGHH